MQRQELNELFRQNLRQRRKALKMTQIELANQLGVDQGYISDLERGKVKPSLGTLAPIAEALDTVPSELLSVAAAATGNFATISH